MVLAGEKLATVATIALSTLLVMFKVYNEGDTLDSTTTRRDGQLLPVCYIRANRGGITIAFSTT